MKMLTIFSAYVKASDGFWTTECNLLTNVIDKDIGVKLAEKRIRQSEAFQVALTKRLQEQQEELERLGGLNKQVVELRSKLNKVEKKAIRLDELIYGKEKTNAELIQSNSPKANEEGINRGSQDSQ